MRYNFKDPPHVFSMFISCHLSMWFKSSRHDGSLITRQGRPQNTTIGLLSPRCHQAASGAAEIPMAEFDRLNLQTQEECRTSISKVFRRHFCQAQQWTSPPWNRSKLCLWDLFWQCSRNYQVQNRILDRWRFHDILYCIPTSTMFQPEPGS